MAAAEQVLPAPWKLAAADAIEARCDTIDRAVAAVDELEGMLDGRPEPLGIVAAARLLLAGESENLRREVDRLRGVARTGEGV